MNHGKSIKKVCEFCDSPFANTAIYAIHMLTAHLPALERQAADGVALAEAVLAAKGRYVVKECYGPWLDFGPPSSEEWEALRKLARKVIRDPLPTAEPRANPVIDRTTSG